MDGKKNNIAKWVDRGINVCFYLCLLVVAYVVLQVFVVTSFSIPSDSMEPTLLPGDKILVEKCATGARLFDLPAALAREEVEIYRVPGWRKFRRNDVLVFNFPYREGRWDSIAFDVTKYFVKRCIALPGDTVEIRGGYYHLRGVDAPVGNLQAQAQVAALTEADTARVVLDSYPWDKALGWTIQHFGPLAVPRRGQTVRLGREESVLYRPLISHEQGKWLNWREEEGRAVLGDSVVTEYTFREDYYFMAGDKALNSQDSRYWGLLPESFIVGRAFAVWWSEDERGKTRWNRVWKRII